MCDVVAQFITLFSDPLPVVGSSLLESLERTLIEFPTFQRDTTPLCAVVKSGKSKFEDNSIHSVVKGRLAEDSQSQLLLG